MNTRHAIFPVLATLTLLAPVACDDAALVVDESLLLSDDPDEVDAALDAAADDLAAGLDPSLATCATCKSAGDFSAANKLAVTRKFGVTTKFTIDAWVYRTANTNLSVIASQHLGYFGLGESAGKLQVLQGKPAAWCNTGLTIPLKGWTHIAQSFDSTAGNKIYINGILQTHNCNNLTAKVDTSTSFGVGSAGGGYHFIGHIDQVRVWNVARTETEIQRQMFNDNAAHQGTGLKAFYKLNNSGADSATGGTALGVTGSPWNTATGLAAGAPVGDGVRSYFNPTTKTAYRFWTYLANYAFYTGTNGCPVSASGPGWSLATIKDSAEDTFIDTAINTHATEWAGASFATKELWIGLKDKDGDKNYAEYSDWQRHESVGYTEFNAAPTTASLCVVDNALFGGVYDKWKAIPCTSTRDAICEYRF